MPAMSKGRPSPACPCSGASPPVSTAASSGTNRALGGGRFARPRCAALAAALLAAPAAAASDPDVAARLRMAEAWLGTQLARDGVTGASAAIVHGEEALWARGFGMANPARRIAATPDTRFSICSISKLFTSMLAMQERDAGRLDLDAPVGRVLPWFRIGPVEGSDGPPEPVTARGILVHASGLPRETDIPYWREVAFPDSAAIRARVPQQAMLYPGFQTYQYSNLGMTLLGDMAAATAGQPFGALVTARILAPLGLTRTTPDLPLALHGTELAVGHSARRMGWARRPIPPYTLNGIAPAAGFASTANDLARFAAWQFRLLASGGEEVLKAATLRDMQRTHWVTPDKPDEARGLGFAIIPHGGKTLVGHGGYCPGYRSSLLMRPQERIGIVLLANVDDLDTAALARELYDLVAPGLGSGAAPAARTADWSAFEGRYGRPQSALDMLVVQVGNELLTLPLFQPRGVAREIERWQPAGPDRFRRLLEFGALGEELRFARDGRGRVTQMWRHSNPLDRMPDTG
jgi:CubicO group peptidase (beta-lactamase class C family)